MKSLLKILFFTATTRLSFNSIQVFANETSQGPLINKAQTHDQESLSNQSAEQDAYALGTSFARYLKEQEKLGVIVDKNAVTKGVEDVFSNTNKLTPDEMEKNLNIFQEKVKIALEKKMEKDFKKNVAEGDEYREKLAKKDKMEKTKSGLLYKIEQTGDDHNMPKDTDTVVVHYKGSLINGTEFDNSYKRGEPLSVPLNTLILGWKEGLQKIGKGGKIKLVLPQELAYGKNAISKIPSGSTLIFDVELIDIKPASEIKIESDKTTKQQK